MRLSERKYIRTPCLYVPCLVLKLTYAYDLCQLFFLKKRAMYGLWIWVKILSAVTYTVEYVLFTLSLRCIVELLHILNITGISNFLKKIVMINWICCKLLSIEWLYRFVKGARALFVLHLRCLILIKFSIRLLLLFLLKNTHMFRYPNLSTFKTRTSRNSRLFRSSPPEVFW